MIATAEGIGSGALQARVPTEGVEDVHRPGHAALNAMLDRLEASGVEAAAVRGRRAARAADAAVRPSSANT